MNGSAANACPANMAVRNAERAPLPVHLMNLRMLILPLSSLHNLFGSKTPHEASINEIEEEDPSRLGVAMC
jgi:hypothetical protein